MIDIHGMSDGRYAGALSLVSLLVLAQPARSETWSAILYPDDTGAPTKVVATKPTLLDCEVYIDDLVKETNEKFQTSYKDKNIPAMSAELEMVKLLTRRTVCMRDQLKPVVPPSSRGPTTRVAPSATGSESGHKVCEDAQRRLTQANSAKNLNDAADIIAKWPFHCEDPK